MKMKAQLKKLLTAFVINKNTTSITLCFCQVCTHSVYVCEQILFTHIVCVGIY